MFSSGLYPLITRPTRITGTSATIIYLKNYVLSCVETKRAALFLAILHIICQFSFCLTTTLMSKKYIVSGCKSKTSYGHDEISMKTVKHIIKQIVKPLTHIFYISLMCRSFPNYMKLAKIIPVFKSSDRLKCSNYRHISILSQFKKILETIFSKRLTSFIEAQHILSDGQCGFRSNHSTSLALTEFVEKVTSAMDKFQTTIGVFIDLKKLLTPMTTAYC